MDSMSVREYWEHEFNIESTAWDIHKYCLGYTKVLLGNIEKYNEHSCEVLMSCIIS